MDTVINYLLTFGQLNRQQVDLLMSRAKEITIKKDAYFSEAGKIAKQVGFITKGIVRVCYYNNKGEEITKYFIDENNMVVDLESFNYKVPSSAYVQAVTDCEIAVFSDRDFADFSATIVGWDAILSKVTSKALLDKVARVTPMLAEDAKTRYLNFLDKFPNIANRVPLAQLASYLGITQSSLSRIRKSI